MKKIVLTYHRIDNLRNDYNNTCVSLDNFRDQMAYVHKNFRVIKMQDFIEYDGEEVVFTVTFDDGFAGFISNALPILEEYSIPATIFVTTKSEGDREFWMSDIIRTVFDGIFEDGYIHLNYTKRDIKLCVKSVQDRVLAYRFLRRLFKKCDIMFCNDILSELHKQSGVKWEARDEFRPLSHEQIRSLSKHELITIGAHTVNHPSLGCVDKMHQIMEIKKSIKQLTEIIDKPIEYFAYPFGGKEDYNEITKKILLKQGIKNAFTTEERIFDKIEDYMEIPRVVCENCSLNEWKRRIYCLLYNKDIDCLSSIFFVGKREQDKEIFNSNKIVICGCGNNSKDVMAYLDNVGLLDRVIAFTDNDDLKVGAYVKNIRVCEFSEFYNDDYVDWIVQNRYDFEMVEQLVENDIKKIHWWLEG